MKINSKVFSYQCSAIKLEEESIFIGTEKFSLKDPWVLERLNGSGTIDLSYLFTQFKIIQKKLKIPLFTILIEDTGNGMFIELFYSPEGKVSHSVIHMNSSFISALEEKEILIFGCHELGHVLDADRLIKNQAIFKYWDLILKPLSILAIGITQFLYIKDLPSWAQLVLFLTITFTVFGTIVLLKKLFQALLSRQAEYRADAFSVKIFGDLDSILNCLNLLSTIEEMPTKKNLFSSHPTFEQRIKALRRRFWYKLLLKKIW